MTKLNYTTVTVSLTNPNEKKSIHFVKDGCMLFFNAQHLLIELSAHERAFYHYLCEKMGQINNYVRINTNMKKDFIAHICRITQNKHKPSSTSVTRYESKLTKLGLLILMGSKQSDFYCVNPKYTFKGTVKQRTYILKQLIEGRNKNGLSINMLLNESL